ncbi:MAG: carbohydrate-binding domain-containing protein [Treponema sp.]|nr:carbohydrate-binding domain-containing protein [Treponema sp.]
MQFKKIPYLFIILSFFAFPGCEKEIPHKTEIDADSVKSSFQRALLISPLDEGVEVLGRKIIIIPAEEGRTYELSGYFNGQIIVAAKNTELKLNGAYLENTSGREVIIAKAKTEISVVKDSTNYIVSRGRNLTKKAAVEAKKTLVLGGSGTLYVKGSVCHALEGEDVKIKGSGAFYFEGTGRGSALTCESLEVEDGKTFSAYFLNSKNGIKVDKSLSIKSGNFYIWSNKTPVKTGKNIPEDALLLSDAKFDTGE